MNLAKSPTTASQASRIKRRENNQESIQPNCEDLELLQLFAQNDLVPFIALTKKTNEGEILFFTSNT